MTRVLSHRLEVDPRFPSLLAREPARDEERPPVAQVLETFTLAADGSDSPIALIGLESWVTQVAWISFRAGSGIEVLTTDFAAAINFAFRQLGVRLLLGYAMSSGELDQLVDRLSTQQVCAFNPIAVLNASIVQFAKENRG